MNEETHFTSQNISVRGIQRFPTILKETKEQPIESLKSTGAQNQTQVIQTSTASHTWLIFGTPDHITSLILLPSRFPYLMTKKELSLAIRFVSVNIQSTGGDRCVLALS